MRADEGDRDGAVESKRMHVPVVDLHPHGNMGFNREADRDARTADQSADQRRPSICHIKMKTALRREWVRCVFGRTSM